MNIIPITSTDHWHQIRRNHVGGSEVAALFGMSPYSTRFTLWHVKAGNIPADDLSDNERVKAGNFMEPAIAAWASEKWGVKLVKFQGYAPHPGVPGMGCTPDYMTPDGSLLVQIKNVDGLIFYKSDEWEAEGEILTKAPMPFLLQCQHELACTGVAQCWLVVCIGGNRLVRMEIAARPKTIAKLETEVAAFWASVRDGIEPKPDFLADADTISALRAEGDDEKYIDLSTNNRAHEVVAEWLRGTALAKEGETLRKAARAELLTIMGDATTAEVGDAKISASTVSASKGKLITEKMVGLYVGARVAYRVVSIKTTNDETQTKGEAA